MPPVKMLEGSASNGPSRSLSKLCSRLILPLSAGFVRRGRSVWSRIVCLSIGMRVNNRPPIPVLASNCDRIEDAVDGRHFQRAMREAETVEMHKYTDWFYRERSFSNPSARSTPPVQPPSFTNTLNALTDAYHEAGRAVAEALGCVLPRSKKWGAGPRKVSSVFEGLADLVCSSLTKTKEELGNLVEEGFEAGHNLRLDTGIGKSIVLVKNDLIGIVMVFFLLCSSVVHSSPLDPVRTVFQFPKGTFVENLAVRSNGQILVSVLTTPQLFLFNSVQIGQPILIHNFTGALSVAGIAEYEADIFAVITGNFSFATDNVGPGTWAVWSVDLRGVESQPDNTLYPPPQIYKIADVPEARFLNGMSLLSQEQGTLLVGDVSAGNIIRLDIKTGNYEIVINNTFTNVAPALPYPPSGVDGVHVRDGSVFLTNAGKSIFVKIPIHEDGTPAENGTIVAHTLDPLDSYDDFAFDRNGNAYLVTGSGNSVEKISPNGRRQAIVAGNLNSTMIAEPTSAAFGRGPCDKNILYATTAGGLVTPIDGTIVVGGQLLAITTDAEG